MAGQDRVSDGIDKTRPNVARIYDYLLGGKNNFAADRAGGHPAHTGDSRRRGDSA